MDWRIKKSLKNHRKHTQVMKAEQLMKPRFEVIADYPYPKNHYYYNVGDIIECDIDRHHYWSQYPHLFKKLNWWEHRKAEEMPKRLICKAIEGDTEIHEIEEWDMEILCGWTNKAKREACSLRSFNPEYGYFPVD